MSNSYLAVPIDQAKSGYTSPISYSSRPEPVVHDLPIAPGGDVRNADSDATPGDLKRQGGSRASSCSGLWRRAEVGAATDVPVEDEDAEPQSQSQSQTQTQTQT